MALLSSDIVFSSCSDIRLKLLPRTAISSLPPRVYLASKFRFAICWDSRASSMRGCVILREKSQISRPPSTIPTTPR